MCSCSSRVKDFARSRICWASGLRPSSAGVRIVLTDERPAEPLTSELFYDGGVKEFVRYLDRHKQPLIEEPIFVIGEREGITVKQTAVGDRYILEEMRRESHSLGGEQSGHVILLDHATTGDGILSAVRLLATIRRTGAPLAELRRVMTRLPQVLVTVRDVDRSALMDADDVWLEVSAVENQLGDSGRVLVRPSGTEPVVRVMVEAPSHDEAQQAADRIAAVVSAAVPLPA